MAQFSHSVQHNLQRLGTTSKPPPLSREIKSNIFACSLPVPGSRTGVVPREGQPRPLVSRSNSFCCWGSGDSPRGGSCEDCLSRPCGSRDRRASPCWSREAPTRRGCSSATEVSSYRRSNVRREASRPTGSRAIYKRWEEVVVKFYSLS